MTTITKYRYTEGNQRIETLSPPEGVEYETITEEIGPEPKTFNRVKPIAFRIALLQKGLLSTIESELNKPENAVYKIGFEYALEFGRHDTMVLEFANLLQLTNEQIDEVFETAQGVTI